MANRYFNQFQMTLVKKVCSIYGQVAIGSTGAPTLSVVNSKGILSIVRNSAGNYTITFGVVQNGVNAKDVYVKLLTASGIVANSTGIAASTDMGIVNTAATLGAAGTAASSINVVFSEAGTATELASGDTLYLAFTLQDSTAP